MIPNAGGIYWETAVRVDVSGARSTSRGCVRTSDRVARSERAQPRPADALIHYTVDTSRAVAKMHYSNRFARTPDIKYIFAHAGGTIPYLASRFAIVDEMKVIPGGQSVGAADTFRRLYWDTASAFSDPVLHMLRSVTGLGNVVFGTGYWFSRDAISIAGLRQLRNTPELDDDERRGVLGGSAARLISR